ncbi:MAG TPA: aminotransferase class V-fold PLP-dependent enzyme [Blastocatellia bacterium]
MNLGDAEIKAIRSRFPVFGHRVYLNSCSQGALCDSVEAGIREYTETWHRDGSPWDVWTEKYHEARNVFAKFIGANPDQIAIVASASAAINSIASAVKFDRRPKVVLGEYEFPTMCHIWLAQQQRGARVEFVSGVSNRIPVESYSNAIDADTLIVPLTQVSFLNGNRSDVRAITEAAHAKGAMVMLDCYQDCGTRPIDVKKLGVDFLVSGTLKYLLGPPGLAFLYVANDLVQSLDPPITGWFAQADPFAFNSKIHQPAPTARRFEAGTPPIPNIYAAIPGVNLLMETGLGAIEEHIARLAGQLVRGAQSLGIQIKTAPDSVGPLIVLKCKDAPVLVDILARENIVVSNRADGLRVAFHLYNTPDDVDTVLSAFKENLKYFHRTDT